MLLFLLFFLAFILLLCGLLPNFINFNTSSDELPLSLHSSREADYSRDLDFFGKPRISLRILRDIFIDQGLDEAEITNRLSTLTAVFLTPVSTSTGTLSVADTTTTAPASTQTALPTLLPPHTGTPTALLPLPSPTATIAKPPPATISPPAPKLRLTLSLATYTDNDSSGTITLNDDLRYQIQVDNLGDAPLSNIHLTDITFGSPVSCPGTSLSAGASMLCTIVSTHTVTLAEANAGTVTISVFASGEYGGKTYSRTTSLSTAIAQNPAVRLVKSLLSFDDNDSSGTITQGDGLWYGFELTNSGNVTVTALSVSDDTFSLPVACPPVSLAPGNSVNCNTTGAHIVTVAEANAGEVNNTATASVKFGAGTYTDSDTLVIPLSVQIVKSLATYDDNDSSGTITFGDGLWYQFAVTNIGTLPLSNLSVTDTTFGISVSCPSTNLASGASMTCTAVSPHAVTLAEANAGNVSNAATVTGQPPAGPVVMDTDSVDTPIIQDATLTIAKSANPLGYNAVGQVIAYNYVVTNTGNVTISGQIAVDDDKAADESCPAGNLNPGGSITCTASYTITQADLDSGTVTNTAIATGAAPGGVPVASTADTATVTATQSPSIQIVKVMASYGDLDSSGSVTLGDELWYRFNVSNSGNVTLNPVSVTDDSFGIPVTCPQPALAPGASMLCTADAAHAVTVAEANAGQVVNTASAVGELNGVPHASSDTITTPVSQNPGIQLVKSLQGYADNDSSGSITLNDDLLYQFTVTNSGNVSLGNLSVTDDTFGLPVSCPVTALDPATATTCTALATHTVSLAEADSGQITNSATASGQFNSIPYTDSDALTTPIQQNPAITLVKSGNPQTYSAVGQVITYTYTVQNSGNVTLAGPFSVTDDKTGTIAPCGSGPLSPGATTSCTASYAVTQYDLDFGSVTNNASAGTTYSGGPVASVPVSETVTAIQSPSYSINKSATDVGGDGPGGHANQSGDVITYQITLSNTGNVSLIGPSVSDPLLGALTGPVESGSADGILAVGETWTYSGTYTVTQADITNNGGGDGDIDNTASATTTFLTTPQTASAAVPVDQIPALTVAKSSVTTDLTAPGTVTYNYLVTNTGNLNLTGISLSDDNDNNDMNCPATTLAVGANMTCTATHTFTQAELDAGGSLVNNVTATSTEGAGDSDSLSISITQTPSLTALKTGVFNDENSDTYADAGETISYSFQVTNTGNVTLSNVGVTDPGVTVSGGPIASMAPGAADSTTFTATYTLTQADVDAGTKANTATVTGTPPTGPNVTGNDTANVSLPQSPGIGIVKSGLFNDENGDGYAQAGETIGYTFTVTNTGNVTLTGVYVTDPDVTVSGGPIASLAPAAVDNTTFTATYTLTQTDVDAGTKANTATVSGTPPTGPDVTGNNTNNLSLPQNLEITVVKSVASYIDHDSSSSISQGDLLWYQFEVTNTGSVTLTGLTVTDDTFAIPITCPATTLAPYASTICTANSSYQVTSADGSAGSVANTATAQAFFGAVPVVDSNTLITPVQVITNAFISGQVRDDADGDGDLTDSDAGLANVRVELDTGACTLGSTCPSSTTNSSGNFFFPNLLDGSYVLVETDPPNYISTADSRPPNDNQIDVIISGGASSSGNVFLDHANPASCTAPDLLNGFVVATNPANGAINVPLSTSTITVTFNQPMRTSGADNVLDPGKYEISGLPGGTKKVTITGVTYNPVTFVATLAIDTSDPDWQAGTSYELKIENVKNSCGTSQADVLRIFTTQTEISGRVTNNLDGKGIYGVTVTLTGGSCGGSCGTATTNLNGNFAFYGFPAGIYTLTETDLPGYNSVSDSQGSPTDNQITLTALPGINSTGHSFVDTPASCAAPTVVSSNPANGQTGIPLTTTTLTVTFSQPMSTDSGSVLDEGNFDNNIDNLSLGGDVEITNVSYNPNTFTATLTIDTSDPQWQAGSQYRLRVKDGLRSSCGTKMASEVLIVFSTEAFITGQVRNSVDSEGLYGVPIQLTGGACGGSCGTTTTDINGIFTFRGFAPGSYTLLETNLPGYTGATDSSPPANDQIPFTLAAGTNSSGHFFLDTPSCTGGANFVVSTVPANGTNGVPLTTTTLTVTFNQPMITYGGGSVLDEGNFDNNIDNLTLGGDVPILQVKYDPATYTATLVIDTTDKDWKPGSQYRLRVKNGIKNACDVRPTGPDADYFFTTDLVISGQVRDDVDGDGDLNDLDSGIAGVTIQLYNGICILGSNCPTRITNSGGFFTFNSLTPGNYTIYETDPPGYISTADSAPPNNNQIPVTLVAGVNSIGHRFLDYSSLPTISIANRSEFERNTGNNNYQFVISLSKTSASTITVDYATTSGSAVGGATCSAGVDYVNNTGVVTFSPGASTQNVIISVCPETVAEPDETFSVVLSAPVNAIILKATGTGFILDDDSAGFSTGNFVKAISPPAGATNVPRSTSVMIEFNRDMCESTVVDPNNVYLAPSVAGVRTYNPATRTVTFVPSSLLSANTNYQVSVRFTKTQVDGCSVSSSPYSQSFTTGN